MGWSISASTRYRKGHKYITVIVNHDPDTVVWIGEGHGKAVLEQFYRSLTPEQLASIKVVTGDGARWITDCVNRFTPDCDRCVDPFHVVEWAMEALASCLSGSTETGEEELPEVRPTKVR